MFKNILLMILRGYRSISLLWMSVPIPFAHSMCKYQPQCGEYASIAVSKYGAITGLRKTITRILRCNPWAKGGIDQP